jgi:hypothetical protein
MKSGVNKLSESLELMFMLLKQFTNIKIKPNKLKYKTVVPAEQSFLNFLNMEHTVSPLPRFFARHNYVFFLNSYWLFIYGSIFLNYYVTKRSSIFKITSHPREGRNLYELFRPVGGI